MRTTVKSSLGISFRNSLLTTVAFVALGAASPTMAANTNCGNGSNDTTPGTDVAGCGLYNNVGTATGQNNAAFGISNQTINSTGSTAVGNLNVANGLTYATAVGTNNSVQGDNSAVVGSNNFAYGNNMSLFGASNRVGVFGSPDISATSSVVGDGNTVTNTGLSFGATGASVLGYRNNVNGDQNIAVGHNNTVGVTGNEARYSMVIGSESSVNAYRSIALGNQVKVGRTTNSDDAVAIGSFSEVDSRYGTAVGTDSLVKAEGATALGAGAAAYNVDSTAIGRGATVNSDSSVALGSDSAAAGIHTGTYTLNGSTAAGIPNSANGVVSVGRTGHERQIQNVAAGVLSATSTDAVNGSQLYSVGNQVNNVQGQVNGIQNQVSALGGAVLGVQNQLYGVRGRAYEGTAAAFAAVPGYLPENRNFGVSTHYGNYMGRSAIGGSAMIRANQNVVVDVGVGVGLGMGSVGGRAGATFVW